jgi:WD40 repeat protein
LASTSSNDVVVWDLATGAELQTLTGDDRLATSVAFSHNSKLLVSDSEGSVVWVWDLATGKALKVIRKHWDVNHAIFSHDGKQLAISSRDRLAVYMMDQETEVLLQGLDEDDEDSDDSDYGDLRDSDDEDIEDSDDKGIEDLEDIENLENVEDSDDEGVHTISFSHDGMLLASTSGDTVTLWNATTGAALQTLEVHGANVQGIVFSRNGKLLASASDHAIVRIWDLVTGTASQTLDLDEWIRRISFSKEGPYLEADGGSLGIQSCLDDLYCLQQFERRIFVKGDWITRGKEGLLWIPPDYRLARWDVRGDLLALGIASGQIAFLEFSFP